MFHCSSSARWALFSALLSVAALGGCLSKSNPDANAESAQIKTNNTPLPEVDCTTNNTCPPVNCQTSNTCSPGNKEANLSRTLDNAQLCLTGGPTGNTSTLCITRGETQLTWKKADGSVIVTSSDITLPAVFDNPDKAIHENKSNVSTDLNTNTPTNLLASNPRSGINSAYPGLSKVSYKPLAFLTQAGWQHATAYQSDAIDGQSANIVLKSSSTMNALLQVRFLNDGNLQIQFVPQGSGVQAVGAAFANKATRRYYGVGQRFSQFNLQGSTQPLWISHGLLADRNISTNEIASSFYWSHDATEPVYGFYSLSNARGEFNFGFPLERPDAVNIIQEDSQLPFVLYRGTPQQVLSSHTAIMGRPAWYPPEWMFKPAIWQDSDTTTASVMALINGMAS